MDVALAMRHSSFLLQLLQQGTQLFEFFAIGCPIALALRLDGTVIGFCRLPDQVGRHARGTLWRSLFRGGQGAGPSWKMRSIAASSVSSIAILFS